MAQRCAVLLISVVVERNRARHARTRISTVSRDSVHVAPSRTELTGTDGDSIVITALSIKDCSRHSALEVFINDMRYINPRFTYLLTYSLLPAPRT